jgi:cation:H+ antiporter
MIEAIALLLLSGAAIYLCCESFTNGVEWLGLRLKLSHTATGTVLAAIGTALPEGVVTLMATGFARDSTQQQIGIGAAIGGPLALSTVGYAAVGIALMLARRCPTLSVMEQSRLIRDQWIFLVIFACKIALGLFDFEGKSLSGWGFLAAYVVYLLGEMRHSGSVAEADTLDRLKLRPKDDNPGLGWIMLQCCAAAAVIFAASRLFVGQLEEISSLFGLPPQLTALFLSPLATELPETLNALIWVRAGKDRLALANISGSMMIQATIPTSFGLFFTPWRLDLPLLLAGGATALAILYLTQLFRRSVVNPLLLAQALWPLLALGLRLAWG